MITIPLHTAVVYVDGEGASRPARVIGNHTDGTARIAFDEAGDHTALAAYSDEKEPGTFHLQRDDAEAAPAPARKKFRPGVDAGDEPATTQPTA